ncbi:histidine ammonia-lyase [Thermaerobacter subterraneus]|uniref:Histidine ammonia-lyase n=1 Tax=Thermaerobacter subterraneus DSM 13965 TaxID=867903 RepID=K6Q3Q1_9FIRM|nr:histidine ammonia-lyase [Thermaerobacter subterraneus]EKP95918.1 histidine ammonia-lyase [Thermaerobacter subterraneus DSM 13965]
MTGTSDRRALVLDGCSLTLAAIAQVARESRPVALDPAARQRMEASRRRVEAAVARGEILYGITTGFGKLADVAIPPAQARQLQENLLRSHAAGVGEPLPTPVVRAMMLLRANALARGFSGVRPEVVERLLDLLNHRIHPVVPSRGSLGASGDLAPLAHLALVLIGRGAAEVDGQVLPGARALARRGLEPLALEAKEGLALINGTQAMTALGCLAVEEGLYLAAVADAAGALTLQALRGIPAAFDPRIHALRPHPGQQAAAAHLRRLLAGSRLVTEPGQLRVQDAYSLRCMPQVHGAVRDALAHATRVLAVEANSVTDNPLIFPDEPGPGDEPGGAAGVFAPRAAAAGGAAPGTSSAGNASGARGATGDVLSGGNFHGEPVALVLDYAAMALAELAGIAERRVERLVNPQLSGLPAFLTRHGGLNSGLMLAQYTAAALVSENKTLAVPASVDSIPSSANQEDHVSMGMTAALKLWRVVEHTRQVLAIELLCAAQALDLVGPAGLSPATQAVYEAVRAVVPPLDGDRELAPDMAAVAALLARRQLPLPAAGDLPARRDGTAAGDLTTEGGPAAAGDPPAGEDPPAPGPLTTTGERPIPGGPGDGGGGVQAGRPGAGPEEVEPR